MPQDPSDRALLALLRTLAARGYGFVPPTPATHARVVARADRKVAHDLTDIFGWSLPFEADIVDREILALMDSAGIVTQKGNHFASTLRVASLHGRLFLHSAYPTDAEDAVFLGPDSYRFADLITAEFGRCPGQGRVVDIGAGAGVGAIVAANECPDSDIVMTDINPKALRLARINAAHAGVDAAFVETDGLDGVDDPIDVALANPPYIVDAEGRAYRDGGDMHGAQLSLDMAKAAVARLAPGGRLILYTGSAIVRGQDRLREALETAMAAADCTLHYREIDPDVFGEELAKPAYADVDRIAVVAAIATKR